MAGGERPWGRQAVAGREQGREGRLAVPACPQVLQRWRPCLLGLPSAAAAHQLRLGAGLGLETCMPG